MLLDCFAFYTALLHQPETPSSVLTFPPTEWEKRLGSRDRPLLGPFFGHGKYLLQTIPPSSASFTLDLFICLIFSICSVPGTTLAKCIEWMGRQEETVLVFKEPKPTVESCRMVSSVAEETRELRKEEQPRFRKAPWRKPHRVRGL